MVFLKVFATETAWNRLYQNILYVLLTLIIIIPLNKFNIEKIWFGKKFKGWWWWRIIFTYFNSFVYFIDRVVIYDFSSIFICMWHHLLYHNFIQFQHLFPCINILFYSHRYLVSLCCWCIWLRETLFQTQKTFLILPKGSILYSMNIVSTEAPICSWIQISNILLYSLHDRQFQHCPLSVPR